MYLQIKKEKLKEKVAKAKGKLDAYLERLLDPARPSLYYGKTFAEREGTPGKVKLQGIYASCKTWSDCLVVDVDEAKKELDLYESADFNAIRQTIKEQTGTFKQMFIDEVVRHADFIVKRNKELIDCYQGFGKYSAEAMEGMTIEPSDNSKYEIEGPKVLGPKPENRFSDEYADWKKLRYNAWSQVKSQSEFDKVRYADQYDLQKLVSNMRSYDLELEKCKEEQKKNAISHFSYSLTKLSFRIMEHGLDWSNLKIESAHVRANLNCIITDGKRKLEAFTILAYGPIVSPHYRFLIKERKTTNKGKRS
tara:strand:- start:2652 stop:3572 length:921 start_codon:yes stop_codon:yes gene_type:complete